MIIDGKAIANKRSEDLKSKIQKSARKPKLVAVIVGQDPASVMYVEKKSKKAAEVGIDSETIKIAPTTPPQKIIRLINSLNKDKTVTGILVQLPFPKDSPAEKNQREILDSLDPIKDVDCLTSANMGLLAIGSPRYYPATVKGILTLLGEVFSIQYSESSIENKYIFAGKNVTVIGRSDIVGKPMAMAMINLGATVTVLNSSSSGSSLRNSCLSADILVSATGVAGLIKGDMVKKGAIVIDAGISKPRSQFTVHSSPKDTKSTVNSEPAPTVNQVMGDVDFETVQHIASAITPVPGGVGPMTIVSLLENTFEASLKNS